MKLAVARPGKIGDGKIFVLDVERALRVRTDATDDEATPGQTGMRKTMIPTAAALLLSARPALAQGIAPPRSVSS